MEAYCISHHAPFVQISPTIYNMKSAFANDSSLTFLSLFVLGTKTLKRNLRAYLSFHLCDISFF